MPKKHRMHRMHGKHLSKVEKREVKKIISGKEETKYLDTVVSSAPITNTGVIRALSLVPEGSDNVSRIGKQIELKKVSQLANISAGTTGLIQTLRHIIFQDKMQNGTIPTVAEVLETVIVYSTLNFDNFKQRFHLIKDEWFTIIGNETAGQLTEVSMRTRRSNLFGKKLLHKVQYLGTDNSQGAQGKNNVYEMWLGDSSAGTTQPLVATTTRIEFKDA